MSEDSGGSVGCEHDSPSRPADSGEPASAASPPPWPGRQVPPAPDVPVASLAPRNNRVAVAALVCGLGQFLLGVVIVGNIVLAVPAIICGVIGLRQISRRGDGGRSMAVAGLVLGILGVVYFVIIVVALLIYRSLHGGW